MTFSTTVRRPLVAAVALAAGAAIALTGCSSDDSTSAADSSASASTSAAAGQSTELTVEDAQKTLRTALDAGTPEADLDGVVQFADPSVKTALVGYNTKASKAGYTPEIYTVKSVKVEGEKATAVVAVKSPHAPAPIDMNFAFVNVDGTWKLASEAVAQLTSMMR